MTPQWAVFQGDALELLRTLPSESVDSIVTDPPYGLGNREPSVDELVEFLRGGRHIDTGGDFMGKQWKMPSVSVWRECLRVLKPGGHLLSFGGTRTFDLISLGLRAAGFEYRDTIQWLHGSGFPKSLDVALAIDKSARGAPQGGRDPQKRGRGKIPPRTALMMGGATGKAVTGLSDDYDPHQAETQEAQQWSGWGTALKPGQEPILMFRKPLAGTVASNVLAHGTGAINVDGCRVGTDWNEPDRPASWAASGHSAKPEADKIAAPPGIGMQLHPGGRWPTNAVLTHSASCRLVGSRDVLANGSIGAHTPAAKKKTVTAFGDFDARGAWQAHGNGDGTETVAVYDCADDCPVRVLERQSGNLSPGNHPKIRAGIGYGSTSVGGEYAGRQTEGGTAARFFPRFEWSGEHDDPFLYTAKASTKEREAGCEDVPSAESGRHNDHTTVKSVALMRWLVRLVTPPGGVCLDVFCGSGTTGVACVLEGFHFMGFEAEARFVDISRARIGYWAGRRTA